MKRTLIAVAALIGLASAANAATLTVVANQAQYQVNDVITLTVTGDSQGASALSIFGRLNFSGAAQASAAGLPTQTTLLALGSLPWTAGPIACNSSSCEMMNQLSAFGLSPAPASNLLVATVSFLATTVGTTNVNWETNPGTGFQLDFFGLTNATGTSFEVVPEPTTAALLGLGLLGLAVTGRRRA
jgi:hypothetical protein